MSDTLSSVFESRDGARRAYTWAVWGCYGVGIVGLLVGIAIERELAGTVVYLAGVWIGLALGYLVPRGSSMTFHDERDLEQLHEASGLTISILVYVGLTIVPAAYVLDAAGEMTIGATAWGAIYLYGGIGLLWGACLLVVRYRN